MQFDPTQRDKFMSLDDESFKTLARTIAEATGASKAKTEMMLANTDMLKKRIATMSKEEAEALINSARPEKSEEILKILRQRGVDLGQ